MANPSSGHQGNDRSLENRQPELWFAAVFGGKCVEPCGPDADDKRPRSNGTWLTVEVLLTGRDEGAAITAIGVCRIVPRRLWTPIPFHRPAGTIGTRRWLGASGPVWMVVVPLKMPAGRSSGSVCRNRPDP
jgi:hypothetical protein